MSLAASLFTLLSGGSSATGAIVGTGSACKVFPGIAAHGTEAPYVVFQDVSSVPTLTHDAASSKSSRLVQFSCVASTYLGALALGAAVVADIDSVALAGGELCLACSQMDGFSEATDLYIRIVEATIWAGPN